jgi:hypothetical protein
VARRLILLRRQKRLLASKSEQLLERKKVLGLKEVVVPHPEWNTDGVSVSVNLGGRVEQVSFVSSEGIGREVDFLLPLTLLPAMRRGSWLKLPGTFSSQLLLAVAKIQDIFCVWDEELFEHISLEAQTRRDGHTARASGVGCFFSGGVDSFYTLLKHRDEITHLIFVHGFFGLPLTNCSLREQASQAARQVARELGKTLIEVETNLMEFSDSTGVGWLLYNGAALASVGLLFQHLFHKVFIPSTNSYAGLISWGSHSLVDPLWSTELTDFEHDGCEAKRSDAKVAYISKDEAAMKWLRVCNEGLEGTYNCGRCSKCLQTMIALRVAGSLQRCKTFPSGLDLQAVANMDVNPEYGGAYLSRQALDKLVRLGSEPELAEALAEAISKGLRRSEVPVEHGEQEHLHDQLLRPYAQVDMELNCLRVELAAAQMEVAAARMEAARYSARRYKVVDTLTDNALRIPGLRKLLHRKAVN